MSVKDGYVNEESKYFPEEWDDETRKLVRFMIQEAFQAGQNLGYDLGVGTGKGVSISLLNDAIEYLQGK